jgi:hypothetical protein
VNSRFRPSDWLLVGGGLLMLMASVLPWWEVDWDGQAPRTTFDAFDYTTTGLVPLVLFLGVAVLIVIIKTESLRLPAWLVNPVLIATAIGLGSVLVVVRFVWSGMDDPQGVSRGVGLYVAGVAVLLSIAGCVVSFREADEVQPQIDEDDEDEDEDEDEDDDDDVDDDDDDVEDVYGYDDEDDLTEHYSARVNGSDPAADPPPRRTPTRGEPRPRRHRDGSNIPPRSRRRPTAPPGP